MLKMSYIKYLIFVGFLLGFMQISAQPGELCPKENKYATEHTVVEIYATKGVPGTSPCTKKITRYVSKKRSKWTEVAFHKIIPPRLKDRIPYRNLFIIQITQVVTTQPSHIFLKRGPPYFNS